MGSATATTPAGGGKCPQVAARNLEQRPHVPAGAQRAARGHGRHALHAGAAQELQQQRLGLVLGMVRGQQALARPQLPRQRRVTRIAGRRLDGLAMACIDNHGRRIERNAQLAAQGLTGATELGGGGLQTVIHMHGPQRQPAERRIQLRQCRQQTGGIGTAADGDHQAGRRGWRMRLQQCSQRGGGEAHSGGNVRVS